MNKIILFALPIVYLVVACAAPPPTKPQKHCQSISPPGCDVNHPIPSPTINVNTNAAANPVNPPIVCVEEGTTVTFKITPVPNNTTTVATVPKNPAHTWILAPNSAASPDEFSFTVPDPLAEGDYGYMVVTGKGFCVDPIIRVTP
jgi:hypothetical protein